MRLCISHSEMLYSFFEIYYLLIEVNQHYFLYVIDHFHFFLYLRLHFLETLPHLFVAFVDGADLMEFVLILTEDAVRA